MGGVRRDLTEGILVLTLDAPERRNALSVEIRDSLRAALAEAQTDDRVRGIVLAGAGGAFCAGGDIDAMAPGDVIVGRRRLGVLHDVVRLLAAGEKPTAAAVSGPAYGGGFGLATACDYVAADETARFCASFNKVGLAPDCGILWTLPQRVGAARARQMFLEARVIDSREALETGIADAVTETDALLDRARAFVAGACCNAPLPTGFIKRLMADRMQGLEDVLSAEMDAQMQLFATGDHAEARAAFLEKRAPVFRGA